MVEVGAKQADDSLGSSPREPLYAGVDGKAVSVIIPTYNEAENIVSAVARVRSALPKAEIIIVDDDSPDLTWQIAQELAETDPLIHTIRRTSDRGLSASVVEGFRAAKGRVLAVVDADGQHDEQKLPELVASVVSGADIAVGSRVAEGGTYGDWKRTRKLASHVAANASKLVVGRQVGDPMSGFFVVRRTYFDTVAGDLNLRGFKILLELLSRGRPVVTEVGYSFRNRVAGESNLKSAVIGIYLLALIDLRYGKVISTRFVRYGIVGAIGVLVNFLFFAIGRLIGMGSSSAVVFGVAVSVVGNFVLNDYWTFRDQAHRGLGLARGFLLFATVSCYGLVIQLAVFRLLMDWNLVIDRLGDRLGEVFANLTAIVFAVAANYFLNLNYTWRQRSSRPTTAIEPAPADEQVQV